MPSGRAVLLLRRLSTGDSKLKNFNLKQNALLKDIILTNSLSNLRDIDFSKRYVYY